MKRKIFLFFSVMFLMLLSFSLTNIQPSANSYLSDKREEVIELEDSGVDAICQTDDGYVWIGQNSGLTRYDSKEFKTYNNFTENNNTYDLINIRELTQKDNVLYILSKKKLFKYSNYKFSYIDLKIDNLFGENAFDVELFEFELDKEDMILYITSTRGLIKYDILKDESSLLVENKSIMGFILDKKRNRYFYQLSDGLYDNNNNLVYANTRMLDLRIYNDILLMGLASTSTFEPTLIRYDLINNALFPESEQYDMITDQINIIKYSEKDNMIFVGCDSVGLYCIDATTGEYSLAQELSNKTQIVDLMVDYEGNLWVASSSDNSSGLSIITKNALFNLLFDNKIWQKLDKLAMKNYAIEKYKNILYICLGIKGVLLYDLEKDEIIPEDGSPNVVMAGINDYLASIGVDEEDYKYDIRDVEYFNNKLYFANNNYGLVEYDLETEAVRVFDKDYLTDDDNIITTASPADKTFTKNNITNIRCLRAFNDYLVYGYQGGGIVKFDGEKLSIFYTGKSTIYISQDVDGSILFNNTSGIYKVSSDFQSITALNTEKEIEGNILNFLVADDGIYYNLNGKLFYTSDPYGDEKSLQIKLPYIRGSIVQIAKIEAKDENNNVFYKYVITSENQIYITDKLDSSNLDEDNKLINYDLYNSVNGLKGISANTSGYYDKDTSKFYFQTTDGVVVYDFTQDQEEAVTVKMALSAVDVDGNQLHGDSISIGKNTKRLSFNLSVLAFRPNKGYTVYYKLDGVDKEYKAITDNSLNVSYTNLSGGKYTFNAYVVDEFGNVSNSITVTVTKAKHFHEMPIFWVLVVLVALVLLAVLNIVLYRYRVRKVIERQNEYKEITIESIEAIARTIDAKDAYTNGHSKRVGVYSREIAKALDMSEEDVENIYYIALLHDIGKIAIPENILNKPGRLTDEEFDIMKTHTTAGAKILEGIPMIPNIVEGAKYHHEKYGGGGYPTGIKGEEIPLVARIICCADCYDAMATKRVYKEPYTKEKIISEFERCKEIQFDPHIADVVIKLIKEDRLRAGQDDKQNLDNK